MPRRTGHVPSYRLHKPSGQARVIVNGKHHYLGRYGSPESQEAYARLVAELAANGNGKCVEKPAEDLLGLRPLVPHQAQSQLAVQRIADQRQHDVEVYLEGDRGRQSVEVKEVDVLGDAVLDDHPSCVALDQVARFDLRVVGEQQRRFLVAQATCRDLTKGSVEGTNRHQRLVVGHIPVATTHA